MNHEFLRDSVRFPVPLCGVCGDPLRPDLAHARTEFGATCPGCAGKHLPRAVVALNSVGIYGLLRDPKNNQPRKTTP